MDNSKTTNAWRKAIRRDLDREKPELCKIENTGSKINIFKLCWMAMMRPGSDAARNLFLHGTPGQWNSATAAYEEAVGLKAAVAPKTTTNGLVELDVWWREELPQLVKSQGCLTSAQLIRAVEWKLKRGKFRPLMGLVQSNRETVVTHATTDGFSRAVAMNQSSADSSKEILAAVSALSEPLSGVGPATASAVIHAHKF